MVSLRENANILYSLYPVTSILVQPDHIAWIESEPLSPDETRITIHTLVPTDRLNGTAEDDSLWRYNVDLTRRTLNEDFSLAETIQAGFRSGANEHVLFGLFEGALTAFHAVNEQYLETADT